MSQSDAGPAVTAEQRPRRALSDVPWTIGDSLATFALWWLVIIGVMLAVFPTLQRFLPNTDLRGPSLPATLLALFGVTWLYLRRFGEQSKRRWGPRRPSARAVAVGIAGGGAAALVLAGGLGALIQALVDALDGQMPVIQEDFRQLASDEQNSVMLVISSVLVAPLAEETFFRGMFFPALLRRFSLWPAMGLSASLFAVGHLQNTLSGTLFVILVILPLGMLLAWLYHRYETLAVPMAAHATFNLINVVLLINQAQAA